MKAEGQSNRAIASALGVTESAIRKQVGPSKPEPSPQIALPLPGPVTVAKPPSAPAVEPPSEAATAATAEPSQVEVPSEAEALPFSLDADPSDRSLDRLLACFGCLEDAAPVFGEAEAVPRAGVLLAVAPLVASGIVTLARKCYGEIGPAFYGLRTTLVVLLFMALWRIKRPEALKEHDPEQLGRVLGLDRAPEMKTLRKKLSRLASHKKAVDLGAALARHRVEARGELMGFLYVDGHVRAYHGKRNIPKTHVARIRLAMPATTDYWVNDRSGDPLFVVTAPANAGLTKMLPPVLETVRKFDILTYRKGHVRRIAPKRFVLQKATIDGRVVEYRLHDQAVRFLKGKLRLRQITRLTDDGHQTPVITSRWDLPDVEIAYRMFERWRQENFFKYLREEFLLDALVDYHVEDDDPTRSVPNPQRRQLDREIQEARTELARLEQAFGAAAADNQEARRPTMRGFKIANGKLGKKLRAARDHVASLVVRRRDVSPRIEIKDVSEDAVVKLATERKHLTNLIKMVAYQAESDLLALLRPHYARTDDEGRTLLHEVLSAPADLAVVSGQLTVTLRALSSPHRTIAARALCDSLNEAETCFPGTSLRLRYAIHAPTQRGLAFPGPRSASTTSEPTPQPGVKADI
jgi:hypothetical protein